MTVALKIARGIGSRMGADVPKQFVQVNGKPVLFYTLKAFERHPMVDAIELVCVDGWQEKVWAYAKEYGIRFAFGKLKRQIFRQGEYARGS